MDNKKNNQKNNRLIFHEGFTLIEALVVLFIFTVVALTFYAVFSIGMRHIIESKNRLGALNIANEKMEIIRNLKYADIGTQGGIPDGSIPETEMVTSGGKKYVIKTLVQYVDDSFDGTFPTDTVPDDYKRVKVSVSWDGLIGKESEVSLVSRFVPPGLEVASGDGILSINIIDDHGVGVSRSTVHILNDSVNPDVNLTAQTDDSGNLMFPGALQSILGYEITASKDGYETVTTVDPNTLLYTPVDSNASVVAGLLNTKSIVINKLASLKIKVTDNSETPIADSGFHIKGGRILGTRSVDVPPETIYILDADATTDTNGEKNYNNHSPGQFYLSNIKSISDYSLVGVSPISGYDAASQTYNLTLLPGEEKNIAVNYAKNNVDALLVKVLRDNDSSPINNSQVRLTNGGDYDKTISTSFDGVAFFPISGEILASGDYTLEVKVSGYQDYSNTVTVSNLTNQEVKMTANP